MTKDQQDRCSVLWRELLAAGRVRWMAGMLSVRPDGGRTFVACAVGAAKVRADWTPDFTDHATIGCILAMLREAAGDPTLFVANTVLNSVAVVWIVVFTDTTAYVAATTEAEAILLAIKETKR